MSEYIDEGEQVLLHTYNRFPVVFDHGKGVCLYDTDGKEYLDFCAGIAVFALGYGNKEYNDALKAQIEKKNTSKPSKPTKAQVASAEKRDAILAFLSDKTEPMTAAAIAEGMGEDKNSITGFLTRLAKDERVKVSKELPNGKKSKVNLYAVA